MNRIKLFLTDVDGTLTDGGMYYTAGGDAMKKFNARDGMGLLLLQKAGIKVGIITSENTGIVRSRAEKLGVDFLVQGRRDGGKLEAALEICARIGIGLDEVSYIGDDVNCSDLLRAAGVAACPADAMAAVKAIEGIRIMNLKGGEGCVREFAEAVLSGGILTDCLKTISKSILKQMSKVKISVTFMLLAVTFCVCLIVSNLMEIKTVDLGPLTITAGVVVFPISYILNDCIVEVYGFSKARLVIWLGFGMNLLVSLLLQLGIWLPGAPSWQGQEAMEVVFGAVPRIFAASFIAFLCGSMVNAYVMSRMKAASNGRRFSLRAIVSSLWGEGVDSVIFFPIAFGGILAWNEIAMLIITQTFLKTFYEVLILPVTMRVVKMLRDHEGGDVTDDSRTSYKWWKINEI